MIFDKISGDKCYSWINLMNGILEHIYFIVFFVVLSAAGACAVYLAERQFLWQTMFGSMIVLLE